MPSASGEPPLRRSPRCARASRPEAGLDMSAIAPGSSRSWTSGRSARQVQASRVAPSRRTATARTWRSCSSASGSPRRSASRKSKRPPRRRFAHAGRGTRGASMSRCVGEVIGRKVTGRRSRCSSTTTTRPAACRLACGAVQAQPSDLATTVNALKETLAPFLAAIASKVSSRQEPRRSRRREPMTPSNETTHAPRSPRRPY